MEMLSRAKYQKLKKDLEPIKELAMHDDADGISSGVLMSYLFDLRNVMCPKDFGDWPIKPYKDDKGELRDPPEVCVDMVPKNPKWNGKLVIDHHTHPPEDQRNYKLIHGDVPAALMIYKLFREFIPEEQRWKAVVGTVGDGAPELIPVELWRQFPALLEDTVTTWEGKGFGQIQTNPFPLYLRLSAPINAACKLGKWYTAYSVLRNAKSPWDIIKDSALQTARSYLREEERRAIRNTNPIQLRNGIRLWAFKSEAKIERTLAWKLWEKDKRTVIALNVQTSRGSIRGTLATLIYQYLQENGYKASGHPGFGGIQLKPDQSFDTLHELLAKLKL